MSEVSTVSPGGTPNPTAGADGAVPGLIIKTGGLGSPAQALALATLCAVLFLTFLDNTVVSVGLADVQSGLHAGITSLQWVVNGYALTFAAFMLAGGTLGDRLGRKKVMLAGVAVFCAGSVVCATATNVDWLIAGRVIMGLGAAASEPGTLSIIRHVYPDEGTRADALGVWAAVSGLALALGPVIGGLLVGYWSWRAIFWFNLVIGALALVMASLFVPETSDREEGRLDWLGIILGALALGTISFAIIQGEQSGYLVWWIDVFFALSVVFGAAFILVEHRVRRPILDLALFRRGPFTGSVFVAFAAYFGTFSIFFFTALYLQVVVNASAYATAATFLPMAFGLIIASVVTGPWVARQGPRPPDDGGLRSGRHRHFDHERHPRTPRQSGHAGLGARHRRHRLRHHVGPGHLDPARRGGARALGHGRLGHQHQPGDGGRVRRGRAGVHRELQADRPAGGPAEGARHTAQLPEPRPP